MDKKDKFIFLQQTYYSIYPLLTILLLLNSSQNITKSQILMRIHFQVAFFINSTLQNLLKQSKLQLFKFCSNRRYQVSQIRNY